MKQSQPDEHTLAELAANLRCRSRLGLGLVVGGPEEISRLVSPAPAGGGLEKVRRNLGQCTRCGLAKTRRKIVFGQGPEHPVILFVGEAPGAREDATGVPFVGDAGKLLDRMLAAVGLARAEVYITNIVKCRPPGNRDPEPEETGACRPFLEAQIAALSPGFICTLGRPAGISLTGKNAPISTLRGAWHEFKGIPVLPTFHPAYLLRNPGAKAEAYRDFKALARSAGAGETLEV